MQSRIVFASILGCIALTIVVVLWIGDTHPRLPEVPNPDLSQAFPEVARAIEEQRKVVLSDSQSGAEWGRYAMLLDAHEFDYDAVVAYESAASLDSSNPTWSYLLGEILANESPQKARAAFAKSEARGEKHGLAATRIAEIDLSQNEFRTAVEAVKRALEINPQNQRAFLCGARIDALELEPADALESIQAVQEELNDRRDYWELVSNVAMTTGHVELAKQAQEKAEALPAESAYWENPYLQLVAQQRVDPYWQARQYHERVLSGETGAVVDKLRELLAAYPEIHSIRVQCVDALVRTGQFDAARVTLDSLPKDAEENFDLLCLSATTAIHQEDWVKSEQELQRALAQRPNNVVCLADLAHVFEEQKRMDEALKTYNKVLEFAPDDEEALAQRDRIQQLLEQASAN
ncbi:MAG: tetratricopeptide repeat protein [Planctomycetaceae bacterium]|nr:tetratricopeptide repeat protein [Planctomycetaceae bacterium]MCA9043451.1 tetratricopeptide repeat protein [Planctomycetaceae bacterium]MCB9954246.1 tetratricopeptide repeat protein [Planctomycetaceae bacterium]